MLIYVKIKKKSFSSDKQTHGQEIFFLKEEKVFYMG
jgi:hypothetical protein